MEFNCILNYTYWWVLFYKIHSDEILKTNENLLYYFNWKVNVECETTKKLYLHADKVSIYHRSKISIYKLINQI